MGDGHVAADVMSREVLVFLSRLLAQVTLSAGADDFEETAALVVKARRELAAALDDPEASSWQP